MAWEINLTVLDLPGREVQVQVTRTDAADPEDIRVYSTRVVVNLADLQESRNQVVASIWSQYQDDLAREGQIAALLDGWEDALATALQAEETP